MKNRTFIDKVLILLWLIAILMGIALISYLIVSIFQVPDSFIKKYGNLLSALFILIASGIASASIMKSIEATKKQKSDESKESREKSIMFLMYVCYQVLREYTSIHEGYKQIGLKDSNNYLILNPSIITSNDAWESFIKDEYFQIFDEEAFNNVLNISTLIQKHKHLIAMSKNLNGLQNIYTKIIIPSSKEVIETTNKLIDFLKLELKK